MASAYDPANSLLGWNGFADGRSIGTPGAPAIDNTPNPYSAMAAEMAGELALNAGTEYMAPEGAWNEALGKWVYTKKPGSSMFGSYEIPADSVWSDQVPVLMKQLEIKQKKEAEAAFKATNKQMNYQRDQTFDQNVNTRTGVMTAETYSDAELKALKIREEEIKARLAAPKIIKDEAAIADEAGGATVETTPYMQGLSDNNYLNVWTDRDRVDDPNKSGVSNWWENSGLSNKKDNAFDYVQDMLEDGMGSAEWNLSTKNERADDMMDEVRHWMGSPNNIMPSWTGPLSDSVNSPAWKHFNEHPEEWAEFSKGPVKWFFTNKEKYDLEVQTGILSGLLWDDWYSVQVEEGAYDAVKISDTFDLKN